MKQKKLIKLLIPLVAIIVVIESVVLVSSLSRNNASNSVEETPTETPPAAIVETGEPVADFIFETETKEMKPGKSYQVHLSLVGKQDFSLGAMEVYVKYDSSKLTVAKLSLDKSLPETAKGSGINSGLISTMLLWNIGESYPVKSGTINPVLSFEVTPQVEGETEISLITGNTNEKSVTIIVEDSTSKPLAFLGNKLEINVSE